MNRLALIALIKTTRPLLYGAMGSGLTLALLPLALVLGTNAVQAITHTISQSFTVPIQTPAKACVAVNGEAKCSPVVNQVVTATTSARISESESLHVTDGAPSFTDCNLLAKTVAFAMQVDDSATITVTGTSPAINQTISSGPVGSPPTTVEVCIGST
jgi:hypothetical protein